MTSKKKPQGKQAKEQNTLNSDRVIDLLCTVFETVEEIKSSESLHRCLAIATGASRVDADIEESQAQNDLQFMITLEELSVSLDAFFEEITSSIRKLGPRISSIVSDIAVILTSPSTASFKGLASSILADFNSFVLQVQLSKQRADVSLTSLYSEGGPDVYPKIRQQIFGDLQKLVTFDLSKSPWKEVLEFINDGDLSTRDYRRQIYIKNKQMLHPSKQQPSITGTSIQATPSYTRKSIPFLPRDIETLLQQATTDPISITMLLVVGAEGSGKTTLCENISRWTNQHEDNYACIFPNLAFDMMCASVGATEQAMYALACAALPQDKASIILFDDIEHILGMQNQDSSQQSADTNGGSNDTMSHVQLRQRACFFTILDALEQRHSLKNGLVIICTAKSDISESLGRVDIVHMLSPSTEEERNMMLLKYVDAYQSGRTDHNASADDQLSMVSKLVEATDGMPLSELSRRCRGALLAIEEESKPENQGLSWFEAMQHQIQSFIPPSLRNVVQDDFLDISILSAADLIRDQSGKLANGRNDMELPLFGDSAKSAWREMQRLIVAPLCHGNILNNVLHYGASTGGKQFCGGVILCGSPGTGKSALAYHCGRVAASILPTMQFIDINCAALIRKELGGSERAITSLFKAARAAAPCILMMDGIENIAAVRGNDPTTEGTMDRVLSTLLTELDGVDSNDFETKPGIAVIGISHNVDWIDAALKRPGRLEKSVRLESLDRDARYKLMLQQLRQNGEASARNALLADECTALASLVADGTGSISGASVIHICNQARLNFIKEIQDISVDLSTGLKLSSRHFDAVLNKQ